MHAILLSWCWVRLSMLSFGLCVLAAHECFCLLQFPVGRTRLETVSVIICAVIMSIATVLVIRESVQALIDGLTHGNYTPTPLAVLAYNTLHILVTVRLIFSKYNPAQCNNLPQATLSIFVQLLAD